MIVEQFLYIGLDPFNMSLKLLNDHIYVIDMHFSFRLHGQNQYNDVT